MQKRIFGCLLLAASLAACSDKQIQITNPNSPTVAGASSDPSAFQLLATGLLSDYRGTRSGYIQDLGRFGREMYVFTPNEGRNTTHYLIGIVVNGQQVLDPTGFAVGEWGTQYNALRDIFNFTATVTANGNLSATQKSAALGFAETIKADMWLQVIATRDTLGMVLETKANPTDLAPFVSRDSAYKAIIATLQDAATKLAAGGSAFPFTLHSGFTGFNTPATFATFTQALLARAAAYYATEGGPASMWTTELTALGASFLNATATTRAGLDVGVYHVYSTTTGDVTNPVNATNDADLYAHMSIQTDLNFKVDGTTPDDRYTAKIRVLPSRTGPAGTSGTSTLGFQIWPNGNAPIAVIRNEELILLRAEGELATGNAAGAIADLNSIRVNSGGLPPTTLTPANTTDEILTGILYEKRYSTLLEGLRWVDMRRYGKLNLLPLDISSGANKNFVAKVMPIPQAECLVRVGKAPPLAGPGC